MMMMIQQLVSWFRRDAGQDLTEYGLLAMLIAVAVAAVLPALGAFLQGYYEGIATAIGDAGL